MSDEKVESKSGKPFQLRPSILGTESGLSSPFATSISNDTTNKSFVLRPSALTSTTDKLKPTDTRKRSLREENEDVDETDTNKKSKVLDDNCTLQSTAVSSHLNETLMRPTGIGTFGFKSSIIASPTNDKAEQEPSPKSKVNYFQQGVENGQKTIGFVFGGSSASKTGGGFKSLNEMHSADDAVKTDQESADDGKGKLLENANMYEKIHSKKLHFQEVEKFTGEEGEKQVLQVICKLHMFETTAKSWQERGRGTLRLNDICQSEGVFQSRLVFRTQGTNLVLLNTMIWPDMCCEKVREKNVRISAVDPDSQEVKVFMINASGKESLRIYTAIDRRIAALKRKQETNCKQPDDQSNKKPHLEQQETAPLKNKDDKSSERKSEKYEGEES